MIETTIDIDALAAEFDRGCPMRSERDRRIALATYRLMSDGPPRGPWPAEIAAAAGAAPDEVERALHEWPGVFRDASGRVIGFSGLSLRPTRHRLAVAGRELFTWCAWDALFLPEILGREARVESTCPATDRLVTLVVRAEGPRELDPPEAVVSFLDPPCACGGDDGGLSSFCQHVHFLARHEVAERWAEKPRAGIFSLTVRQAWELGRVVNRRRYGALLGGGIS